LSLQYNSIKQRNFGRLKKDAVWVELERSGGKAKARDLYKKIGLPNEVKRVEGWIEKIKEK
jgi:hypothetical protein